MTQRIVQLATESIEEKFGKEVEAFKPSGEDHRFVLKVEDTVLVINTGNKTFKPARRGSASTYLDLRKFFREVGLEPDTRS
ncbi:MAG: hypothetical protein ABEJ03_05695 [Candidatus Nanohaloarchaea archaeon]